MNKKRLVAGLLTSATVVGLFATGGTAFAAEVDSAESEVGIGFSNHNPGINPGPLEMKWAPINLNFDNSNDYTQTSFNEVTGSKMYTVVNDARNNPLGTETWSLSAKLGDLMSGSTQLVGAQLEFDATEQGYTGTAKPELPGSIIPYTGTAVVQGLNFTLSQGAAATKVMEDGSGGTGTFQGASAMEMSNIKLNVPSNVVNAGKEFTGKLTWSLNDTP
ncbi:WxL domain-containing protein [Enterococcus hulanensis]|uniref:WxL domain-containing protein n=1 Tax=Enterococcus hulanensis TaxID=2559929 RepID=UPI00288FF557|nr:WxL domain-containing protein [Enterococcus hulanensis]MDT2662678.1 WxL domain-containing protein [Enterococcus hulanensis]